MKLHTDFECGSGSARQTGENSWSIETVADRFGYNKYFCFEVTNTMATCVHEALVDIFPDPALGAASHFLGHFPSHIWYSARQWRRWIPLRHTWEDSVTFLPDRIRLKIPLPAGATLQVATNPPFRHSDYIQWIENLGQTARGGLAAVSSLGSSFQGRTIPVLTLGEGRTRFVVLAGQHASEHSGVWASKGIADFLLASSPEAARLRKAFTFSIVPMLNPDGNVLGRSGAGAEQFDHNNSLDFSGAAEGRSPLYTENRLLWDWLQERKPEVFLHFHGYLGWRAFGDLPGDGIYINPPLPEAGADSAGARYQQAILDRVPFDTPGHTAHFGDLGENLEGMVDYQLAKAFGTVSLLYEVNSGSVGVAEQYRRGPQVLRAVAGGVMDSGSGNGE
jgi:hypothetical protein